MIIGGVLEFVLGNTFPFIVFCSFVRTSISAFLAGGSSGD